MINSRNRPSHMMKSRDVRYVLATKGYISENGSVFTEEHECVGQISSATIASFSTAWSSVFEVYYSRDWRDQIEMAHKLKNILTG